MSNPCPRIVVHQSSDAPDGHEFMASLYLPTTRKSEHVGWARLPTLFIGRTREGAIDAAASFWREQQEKLAAKAASAAARSAKMRKSL
jgi:hypothetical protein